MAVKSVKKKKIDKKPNKQKNVGVLLVDVCVRVCVCVRIRKLYGTKTIGIALVKQYITKDKHATTQIVKENGVVFNERVWLLIVVRVDVSLISLQCATDLGRFASDDICHRNRLAHRQAKNLK